jgi:hypothetical protein
MWLLPYASIMLVLTNSMEPSPLWKASGRLSTQELPSVLLNQKVQYRVNELGADPYPNPDESSSHLASGTRRLDSRCYWIFQLT